MKAVWHDTVIAESDRTIQVEGNTYFPPESVNRDLLTPSETTTTCPWKGKAEYYSITVNGEVNRDAAWSYPEPTEKAQQFKNYVAFWRGVKLTA